MRFKYEYFHKCRISWKNHQERGASEKGVKETSQFFK